MKEYFNQNGIVIWNSKLFVFDENCVKELPKVFKPEKSSALSNNCFAED